MDNLVNIEEEYFKFFKEIGFKIVKKKTKTICTCNKEFTVSFNNSNNSIVMNLVYDDLNYIATAYSDNYIVVTDLSNKVLFYLNRLSLLYLNFINITKFIIYGEMRGNYLLSEVQFLYMSDTSSVRMNGFYTDDDTCSFTKLKLLGFKCVGYRLEIVCKSGNNFLKVEYDVSCDIAGNYLSALYPDKSKMFIVPLERFNDGVCKNYYDSDSIIELKEFHNLYKIVGLLVDYC